ncbi:unnamed protein product, partial [Laminaria digitata]
MQSKGAPPAGSCAQETSCHKRVGAKRVPSPTLEKVEGLLASKKPAILSLERSSAGCRLEIDPDGNCFGTSWMLSSLLSAVQNPTTFSAFIAKLQEADKSEGGAFCNLDGICERYTRDFFSYIEELQAKWIG